MTDARRVRARWPKRKKGCAIFATVAFVGTLSLAVPLWFGVRTVQALGGWFWPLHHSKLSFAAALGALTFSLVAFSLVARLVRTTASDRSRRVTLALLILIGFCNQQILSLAAGRGIDEMRDRLIYTGHAEFAFTATRDVDVWKILTAYEDFVQAPGQRYSRSKPPGQLLFYCAAAAAADRVMPLLFDPPPPEGIDYRHYRLMNFATLFFPLFAMLVLIPLTYLGRCFLGSLRATWPAFVYVLTPGPALIQLHLDQVLYPTLAISFWALVAAAVRSPRKRWLWWMLSGGVLWLSLFVSFSLLPIVPIGIGVAIALDSQPNTLNRVLAALRGMLVAGAVLTIVSISAYLVFGYDPFRAYSRAMAHHLQWKAWDESFRWPAAQLNLLEASYWLGVPVVMLCLYQATYGWKRLGRLPSTVFTITTVVTVVIMAAVGRTIGEVARLWLFLLPAISLGAAGGLARLRLASAQVRLTALAALQVLWMVTLKAFQDFR